MKDGITAAISEHTVNDVRYEVVSTFKNSESGNDSEDLADKIKRLILTENIKPKKK